MELKDVLVLLVVIFFVGFLFSIYTSKDSLFQREKTSIINFSKTVSNAKDVCIIMDVSGVGEPHRKNIFNCGVDFSYSLGLLGKNVVVYAFENGTCFKNDSQLPEAFCILEAKALNCPIIYITKPTGKGSESYKGLLYVEVPEEYKQGQCSIKAPALSLPKS